MKDQPPRDAHPTFSPQPRRRPVLVLAGEPGKEEDAAGFYRRLFQAVNAVARAAFARSRPVAILDGERLLPVLLSISTEYAGAEMGSHQRAWVQFYGPAAEPWQEDLKDWVQNGVAKQVDAPDNEAAAVDLALGGGECEAIVALGGGGSVTRTLRRFREGGWPDRRRLRWFYFDAIGGGAGGMSNLVRELTSDLDALKALAEPLRAMGIKSATEISRDEQVTLYPIIVQTMLDQLE